MRSFFCLYKDTHWVFLFPNLTFAFSLHLLTFFQVTVEEPSTGEAVDFPCRRWLARNEDDGQISRELIRADGKDGDMVVDKGQCHLCVFSIRK